MRVHITLTESVRRDPAAKAAALVLICRSAQLDNINRKRFERYGIVSADLAEQAVAVLRELDVVKSVEPDAQRFAS